MSNKQIEFFIPLIMVIIIISLNFLNNSAGYRRLKIWKRVYKKNEDESRGRANLYTWKWNQAVRDTIIDDDDMSLWHRVTLLRKTGAPHPDVTRKTWHLKHMWISSSYNPIGRLWLQVTSRLLFFSEPKLSSLIQFWKRKKAKLSLTGSIYHQHLAKN